MYPSQRHRRLRNTETIRGLVRESNLSSKDFLVPLFVVEGRSVKDPIPSMPGYFRLSPDELEKEVRSLWDMGLTSVLLFVKVPENLKDNRGKEAINPNGLMQLAVKRVKSACPDMLVMTDVALDPYSSFGHDGIVENGVVLNDETTDVLAEMSVSHAAAGADFVAPSDMMDGRVLAIRKALEEEGLTQTGIMSYSAKYASSFYGPFREALDSAPVKGNDAPRDKKTYQMDPANRLEALREVQMDIEEGADIVMIKPGICYLDIVRDIRNATSVPLAVYQVSGEYAMLKAAAEKGWVEHDAVMMEQLIAFKRAGANIIASYFAKDAARLL